MSTVAEPLFRRVYVWDLVVRSTHWLIALSILVLAFTGFYIGNPFVIAPGPAGQSFVMGWMKAVHSYSAIVFTLSVLARVLWMLVGGPYASWRQFIPASRERLRQLPGTLAFYLFIRRRPPEAVGHNPLAGLTYTLVFVLYLLQMATGLGLYGASAHVGSPMRAFAFLAPLFGGLQTARWIHHIVMWLLLGFLVHHVQSSLLVSRVERNGLVGSIFSGYKFVRAPGGRKARG